MNEYSVPTTPPEAAAEKSNFAEELESVRQQLQDAIQGLYPPFQDLVRGQLQKAEPLRRAAIVLATGVAEDETTQQALTLRHQRIDLAAALEMLNIALAIHHLLLTNSNNQEANPNHRSVTGSVILTGDYCFTQSALFAAKTDNVAVVDLFSQTLKRISEGTLRTIFGEHEEAIDSTSAQTDPDSDEPAAYDIEFTLYKAGIQGSLILVNALPSTQTGSTLSEVDPLTSLLRQLINTSPTEQSTNQVPLTTLSPRRQERWAILQQWLRISE